RRLPRPDAVERAAPRAVVAAATSGMGRPHGRGTARRSRLAPLALPPRAGAATGRRVRVAREPRGDARLRARRPRLCVERERTVPPAPGRRGAARERGSGGDAPAGNGGLGSGLKTGAVGSRGRAASHTGAEAQLIPTSG